jgi:hypothetical protein
MRNMARPTRSAHLPLDQSGLSNRSRDGDAASHGGLLFDALAERSQCRVPANTARIRGWLAQGYTNGEVI